MSGICPRPKICGRFHFSEYSSDERNIPLEGGQARKVSIWRTMSQHGTELSLAIEFFLQKVGSYFWKCRILAFRAFSSSFQLKNKIFATQYLWAEGLRNNLAKWHSYLWKAASSNMKKNRLQFCEFLGMLWKMHLHQKELLYQKKGLTSFFLDFCVVYENIFVRRRT